MQTIVNLGTGGSDLNGQNGSSASADSNDALFLDWPGANGGNYVYLPGEAGSILTATDAALDITGDLEIVAHVALTTIGGAVTNFVLSKGTGNTTAFTYRVQVLTTSIMRFSLYDGTAVRTADSTVVVPYTSGQPFWFKITKNASTREVIFYTSSDGVTFTQFGTAVTMATSATGVSTTTDSFVVGARLSSTGNTAMTVYRVIIKSGIGGTTVLDADASLLTSGSATTVPARTGTALTIGRSDTLVGKAVAVVAPTFMLGADDYITVAHNALLDATGDFTLVAVRREWGDEARARTVASKADTTISGIVTPGYVLYDEAALAAGRVHDGTTTTAGTLSRTSGETGVVSIRRSGSTVTFRVNGTEDVSATAVSGSLANTLSFNIGRVASATPRYGDIEFRSAAYFDRALTDAELTLIESYYAERWP